MPQNSTSFTDALARGVLVFDGAMGTEIYRHHVFTNRSFDELCLSDPKLIETIHRDYCDAGADVLTTNTFGAAAGSGEIRPGRQGRRNQLRRRGDSPGGWPTRPTGPVLVAGSIGPLATQRRAGRGRFEAEEVIAEQAAALWEGGVDFIIFETQPSRAALEQCAAAMKSLSRRAVYPLLHDRRARRIDRRRADRTPARPAARSARRGRSLGESIAAPDPTASWARSNGRSASSTCRSSCSPTRASPGKSITGGFISARRNT